MPADSGRRRRVSASATACPTWWRSTSAGAATCF